MSDQAELRHSGGRPTLLTSDLQEKIASGLRVGATLRAVCDAHGVTPRTVQRWLEKGAALEAQEEYDHDDPHVQFCRTLRCSEGQFEIEAVTDIRASATDKDIDPKPLQWLLAARFNDRWGAKSQQNIKQEVSGPDGKPMHGVIILGPLRMPNPGECLPEDDPNDD